MTVVERDKVASAVVLAFQMHKDQKDRNGKPYIFHPLRVMLSFAKFTWEYQVVAVLHDVIEDTGLDLSVVRAMYGDKVADALDAVSRREGEVYMDFIKRAKLNPIGRTVKMADVHDNLARIDTLPESERGIEKRYIQALKILEA